MRKLLGKWILIMAGLVMLVGLGQLTHNGKEISPNGTSLYAQDEGKPARRSGGCESGCGCAKGCDCSSQKGKECNCKKIFLPQNNTAKSHETKPVTLPKLSKKVLIDESHREFSTTDIHRASGGSCNFGQSEVLNTLFDVGYKVDVYPRGGEALTLKLLSQYRTVILNSKYAYGRCGGPGRCRGGAGAIPAPGAFTPDELKAFEKFVKDGGCLLVVACGSKFGAGDHPEFYNPLISQFGIEFDSNGSWPSNHVVDKLNKQHPITKRLEEIYICHGVEVVIKATDTDTIVLASLNDAPILVITKYGKGTVVAFGGGTAFAGQCLNPAFARGLPSVEENPKLLLGIIKYFAKGKDRIISPGPAKVKITPEIQEEINKLIKELGDNDWKTREKATEALIKIGPPAIDSLKKALENKDSEVRMRAKRILDTIEEDDY